jgi:hypothetical protein
MTKITLDSRVSQHSWAEALCKAFLNNQLLVGGNYFRGFDKKCDNYPFICTYNTIINSKLCWGDSITFDLEELSVDWDYLPKELKSRYKGDLGFYVYENNLNLEWLSEQEGVIID